MKIIDNRLIDNLIIQAKPKSVLRLNWKQVQDADCLQFSQLQNHTKTLMICLT